MKRPINIMQYQEDNEDIDTVIEMSTVDDHPPYAKLEHVNMNFIALERKFQTENKRWSLKHTTKIM